MEVAEHDVIILDMMLPGRTGLSILQELRRRQSDVHVLILTARSAVEDRIAAHDLGADDYLIKPFVFGELLARALVRRRYCEKSPQGQYR